MRIFDRLRRWGRRWDRLHLDIILGPFSIVAVLVPALLGAAAQTVPTPSPEGWVKAIIGPYGAVALLLLLGWLGYRGGLRSGRDVAEMRASYEERLKTQKADLDEQLKAQKADFEERLAEERREVEWWRRTAVDALGAGERLAKARRAMEDSGHGR